MTKRQNILGKLFPALGRVRELRKPRERPGERPQVERKETRQRNKPETDKEANEVESREARGVPEEESEEGEKVEAVKVSNPPRQPVAERSPPLLVDSPLRREIRSRLELRRRRVEKELRDLERVEKIEKVKERQRKKKLEESEEESEKLDNPAGAGVENE